MDNLTLRKKQERALTSLIAFIVARKILKTVSNKMYRLAKLNISMLNYSHVF